MSWKPIISSRATPSPGTRLHVMESAKGLSVVHRMLVPSGACPVSGNPIAGVAFVSYTTSALVVEIVSLREAVVWAATSRAESAPRNIEALAGWIHDQTRRAVRVPTRVALHLLIRPGPQVYSVTCEG